MAVSASCFRLNKLLITTLVLILVASASCAKATAVREPEDVRAETTKFSNDHLALLEAKELDKSQAQKRVSSSAHGVEAITNYDVDDDDGPEQVQELRRRQVPRADGPDQVMGPSASPSSSSPSTSPSGSPSASPSVSPSGSPEDRVDDDVIVDRREEEHHQ